jgi:hypothetical protein
VVRRGHSAARTVGTVSLGGKSFSPDSGYEFSSKSDCYLGLQVAYRKCVAWDY